MYLGLKGFKKVFKVNNLRYGMNNYERKIL